MKPLNLNKFMDNELNVLFQNAVEIVANNKPNKEKAQQTIEQIKVEWQKRKEDYIKGIRKFQYPEIGMLQTIGYKARHMTLNEREYLLSYLMESDSLPFVQSPAYMLSWGDPLSEKRLTKLSYLLFNLTKKINIDEVTIENWSTDLEFIKKKYYLENFKFKWPKNN